MYLYRSIFKDNIYISVSIWTSSSCPSAWSHRTHIQGALRLHVMLQEEMQSPLATVLELRVGSPGSRKPGVGPRRLEPQALSHSLSLPCNPRSLKWPGTPWTGPYCSLAPCVPLLTAPLLLTHTSHKPSLLGVQRPRNSRQGHPSLLLAPHKCHLFREAAGRSYLNSTIHFLSCLCHLIFLPRTGYLQAYYSFSHSFLYCLPACAIE